MKKFSSDKFKKLRYQRHLTLRQVAESVGVTRAATSRWELGGNAPRACHLEPLAATLRCSVDDLLEEAAPVRGLTTAQWEFVNLLPHMTLSELGAIEVVMRAVRERLRNGDGGPDVLV